VPYSVTRMPQISPQYGSLISTGLRDASTKQQPRVNVVEVQDPDPEAAQSRRVTTISVHEVTTPEYVLDLGPPPSPNPRVVRSKDSELTTRQKWGYADPGIILQRPIFSRMSEHTTVHKGFGRFMLEREPVVFEERVPFYPPLPNAAYNFLNKNVEPRGTPVIKSSFDGAALVKDYMLKKNADEEGLVRGESPSLGEQTAEKIDWTHRLYNGGEMSVQSIPGFCVAYWRTDLVTAVDKAKRLGEEPFEMCNKCKKRHIAWGPSVAMHDRDTCLSRLPAWFPAEEFDEPWNAFRQIINKMVRFEEIEQGRLLDPNRMVWDKSFHEESAEWTALGRIKGGWWKCRSGNSEGETEVPIAERRCRLCHRAKTKEEEALEARIRSEAAEKIRIRIWIERCMEIQMMKDRAIVEGRIRHGLQ
jgi:hypothetical protein